MKFIRNISMLFVFVFCFGVMTSCFGGSGSKVTMSADEIYQTAVKGIELGNLEKVSPSELSALMGIKSSDFDDAAVYISIMNIKATEVGIFKFSSDQQSKEIDKAIEKRLKDLDTTWKTYLPDQYELVKGAKKFSFGNIKGYVIADDASKIVSKLESIGKK